MMIEIDAGDLIRFLLLVGFLVLLLPPLASTLTGIVCSNFMPGVSAGWGIGVGLALGVSGVVANIAGLLFLLAFVNVDPEDWAREIFCRQPFYTLYGNDSRNFVCISAVKWAPGAEAFWYGISLITPTAASLGTWWLCRRRMGRGSGKVLRGTANGL